MSAAVWCTINIKLFHKWLEIAIIVVPVFKMFSVFCMKQIFTFRAGFIPGFVVWQNLVGDWNFSDTILCFTTDNIKILILSILVYTFFSRMFDLMLPPAVKHSIAVA